MSQEGGGRVGRGEGRDSARGERGVRGAEGNESKAANANQVTPRAPRQRPRGAAEKREKRARKEERKARERACQIWKTPSKGLSWSIRKAGLITLMLKYDQ